MDPAHITTDTQRSIAGANSQSTEPKSSSADENSGAGERRPSHLLSTIPSPSHTAAGMPSQSSSADENAVAGERRPSHLLSIPGTPSHTAAAIPSRSSSADENAGAGERRPSRLLAIIPSPSHTTTVPHSKKSSTKRGWGKSFRLRPKSGSSASRRPPSELQQETLSFNDDEGEPHPVSFRTRLTRKFRKSAGSRQRSTQSDLSTGRESTRRVKKPKRRGRPSVHESPSPPPQDQPEPFPQTYAPPPSPPPDQSAIPHRKRSLLARQQTVSGTPEPESDNEPLSREATIVASDPISPARHTRSSLLRQQTIEQGPIEGDHSFEQPSVEPNDEFKFLSPGEEPKLDKRFQKRAEKAIKLVSNQLLSQLQSRGEEEEVEEVEDEVQTCCVKWCQPAKAVSNVKPEGSISSLTPQLKRASSMGIDMMKKVLFPAMPHFLQDLWVFLEFGITLLSFILALVGLNLTENTALNVVSLVLSIIGLILALIDGYIYFFQTSYFFKTCSTNLSKFFCRNNSEETSEGEGKEEAEQVVEEGEENSTRKWWQLSDKAKEVLDTWFEVARTVISELILYPLLICDLLDFVSGVSEVKDDLQEDPMNRVDFSLFLIGTLYTIISVYFMRLLVIVGMLIQIRRLPTLSSGSSKGYFAILGRFCLHVVCQIVCHAIVTIAVSAKIHHENQGDQDGVRVSPFLWITIIFGGILPLSGIAAFFLTNYYWMREFSISFWLDMVSLLQGESFAEVMFGDGSTNVAKEKSQTLAEKTEFSVVKKQFRQYQSTSLWLKVFYPLRLPLLVLLGVLYDFALIAFMASMAFSTDSDTGEVTFVLFDTHFLTSMFFIVLVCLLVANFQVLIIINLLLMIFIILFILAAIISPFIIAFYLPYALCGTCLHTLLPKLF